MIIPCYNPCRVCTPFVGGASSPADPDYPFVNLSSEEPDVDRFFGRRFNPPYDPPIGDLFFAIGCLGFCVSLTSQAAANLCAALQAMQCVGGEWPVFNPNGPPPTTNRELFYNNQISCSFNCPDGTPFTFIIAAGVIAAFSQLAADTAAYSYACDQAVAKRICLMALTPSLTCSEAGYVGTVVASTGTLPLTYTIEGDLPPGLVPSSNPSTLFITGVPTVPGDYTFGVRATDSFGNAMTKQCALTVFGIANESPLPDAEVGTPYSVTLFTAGTVTGGVTYSVTVGSLPDGLTLNASTGEISGTPTTEGPVSFTVRATSESIACSKGFGIQVEASSDCPNWDELSWGQMDTTGSTIGGVATFTPAQFVQQANFEGNLSIDNGALSSVNITVVSPATLVYNGPGCNCNLRVEINRTGGAPNAFDAMGYIVVSSLFGFIAFGSVNASGVTNVPFTLQDTLGADDTIEIHVPMTLDNSNFGGGPVRTMQVIGLLSNV